MSPPLSMLYDVSRGSNLAVLVAAALCAILTGCAGVPSSSDDVTEEPDAADQSCECSEEDEEDDSDEPLEAARHRALTTEEITFESRGDRLEGLVDRPAHLDGALGVIVILHDTGPLDRRGLFDGSLGMQLPVEVAVYQEIAEHLAQLGYAVFRFDKRSCVEGGGSACEYPREYIEKHRDQLGQVLQDDARAAIDAARGLDEVDPARLFLLGHGQGAEVALAVADSVDPRGLLLLTPNAHPIDEIATHQTETSLIRLGERHRETKNTAEGALIAEQIEALEATHQAQEESFEALRDGDFDEADAVGVPTATWKSLFDLHERAVGALKQPPAPILALFGERDLDLPADSSERFESHLGDDASHHIEVLPHLTHALVSFDAAPEHDASQVSDELHQMIAEFLAEQDEQS